jgi:phosphatidylinositol alpha-mannosyltransferase
VLMLARGPIVATWHSSITRSRTLSAASGPLQPFLEKISGRIAVSVAARRVQVEHLGGDAVEIPNGVAVAHYATAEPLPGYPRPGTVGFLGRYDEPRKGMPVLLDGLARLAPDRPELRLLIAGRGDAEDLRSGLPPALAGRVELLGQVSEADKARMLRSLDVYCAPNLGGESFGIILLEAMAARAPILASDLDPFRRVLDDGQAGTLFRTGDPGSLARGLAGLLDDPARRRRLADVGTEVVAGYDWPVVAKQIVAVYETVVAADPVRVSPDASATPDLVGE